MINKNRIIKIKIIIDSIIKVRIIEIKIIKNNILDNFQN